MTKNMIAVKRQSNLVILSLIASTSQRAGCFKLDSNSMRVKHQKKDSTHCRSTVQTFLTCQKHLRENVLH